MGKIFDKLKAAYWEFPIIPSSMKDDIFYGIRKMVRKLMQKPDLQLVDTMLDGNQLTLQMLHLVWTLK